MSAADQLRDLSRQVRRLVPDFRDPKGYLNRTGILGGPIS
jgi:hypothetical protein